MIQQLLAMQAMPAPNVPQNFQGIGTAYTLVEKNTNNKTMKFVDKQCLPVAIQNRLQALNQNYFHEDEICAIDAKQSLERAEERDSCIIQKHQKQCGMI